MTDPTELTFGGFTYNGSGQLTRYTDRAGNPISLTYDGSGNLTSITTPNGDAYTFTYDGSQHVTSVVQCAARAAHCDLVVFLRLGQHHGHQPEPAWELLPGRPAGSGVSPHCCGWNDLVEPYIVARCPCVLVIGDLAVRGHEVTTSAWGGVSRSVVVRAPCLVVNLRCRRLTTP